MKKLFALMGLVAALQAASAWGAIVYFPGPAFNAPFNADLSLDINQDGTADVGFSGRILVTYDIPSSAMTTFCDVSGANGAQLLVTNGYAQILASGASVGSGSPGWSAGDVLLTMESFDQRNNTSSDWLGPLGAKGEGYMGIQFNAADGIHYGWIQVSLHSTYNMSLVSPMVVDWAYETIPGQPILAGDKPAAFEATFNGGNEVPPNKSSVTGTGAFVLEGNTLSCNLTLAGSILLTGVGIYGPANPNQNSSHLIADMGSGLISYPPPFPFPPIVPFTTDIKPTSIISLPPSVLIFTNKITLTASQVTELLAGRLYVNFKSPKFRQGELRGAIFPTAPAQFSATLSGRNEFPRSARVQRGEAAFTLAGNNLSCEVAMDVNFAWTGLGIYTSPFATPINLVAKFDIVYGVMIPPGGLPNAPGLPGQVLYSDNLTLTDRQVCQIKNGDLFINVLASRFRSGEIGGRILPNE